MVGFSEKLALRGTGVNGCFLREYFQNQGAGREEPFKAAPSHSLIWFNLGKETGLGKVTFFRQGRFRKRDGDYRVAAFPAAESTSPSMVIGGLAWCIPRRANAFIKPCSLSSQLQAEGHALGSGWPGQSISQPSRPLVQPLHGSVDLGDPLIS